MRVFKDVSAVAGDVTRIWADLLRYKLQKQTEALKQFVVHLVLEILVIVGAFLLAIAGMIFVLIGCYLLLAMTTLGRGGAALILGAIIVLLALVIGLGVTALMRKP